MFQLNLATFRSIRNDKSQFYAIFRNYHSVIWQALIGGAIMRVGVIVTPHPLYEASLSVNCIISEGIFSLILVSPRQINPNKVIFASFNSSIRLIRFIAQWV